MKPRVCLVAGKAASEPGALLAARLRALLDAGWDAWLLCQGERWCEDPGLADAALVPRIELISKRPRGLGHRSLLHRPDRVARYLATGGPAGVFDQRLVKLRPDLIHFHPGDAARRGMRVAKLLGSRVAVSLRWDGSELEDSDLGVLWNGADLLLFPDPAMRKRAIGRDCPPGRAEVMPVPLTPVAPATDGHAGGRRPLRVMSAGPLAWEQGLEYSLHAMRLLLDMGIDCDYRILGKGGEYRVAVAFACHELDLVDHVQLVDGGNGLVEELSGADVLLDAAVTDAASPTALRTAQALGKPFVAARREGLHEQAGISVPRRNPRAIADALAVLARDPALRGRMGEAGRMHANGPSDLDDHLRRVEELYARVLG